nr:general transcriptional corepressor trfA-like isoform X9 [Populus alba]
MEEEKKKKRNKKKKNKQNNHANSNSNQAAEDDVPVDHHHNNNNNNNGQNHGNENDNQVIEVSSNGDPVDVEDFNTHNDKPNGVAPQSSILAEAEKQWWLQREATFEETIKQLQGENDSHIQKEATFEDTIKQLKTENDSHMQKEAGLEMKIMQLQREKDFWLQKEAGLEEKLNHLLDEKAALGLKVASLEEKIGQLDSEKDSWAVSENTTKEIVGRMNIDITSLRMQVVELEYSRNSLVKENQQLKESVSDLKLQLQNVETQQSISSANTSELGKNDAEKEDLNSQIEAACALVDKLITENAELVEKVNELYIKLDQQKTAATASLSSSAGSDVILRSSELANGTPPMSESSESALDLKSESLDADPPAAALPQSSEPDAEEIVQIPLDDNEVPDVEMQAEDKSGVPLTDAPLIGAPFRLISFVAKYVSGADLVNKDDSI